MSIFSKIGHFFEGLFNHLASAYHSLSEKEQDAAKTASGIISVINQNLQATPEIVWELINKAFPDVNKDEVTKVLAGAAAAVKAAENVPVDLNEAIVALQKYLSQYTGNQWIVITKSVVALIADLINPSSVIQKIELVLEFVYQKFIKGTI